MIATSKADAASPTAADLIKQLDAIKTKADLEKVQRFYRDTGNNKSKFIGVRMASLFAVAKKMEAMTLKEVEKLMNSPFYEARMGAVCILDFKARNKKITDEERKALFDLYIRKHDKINNWDMIDRAAPHVVGGYLITRPRKILYELAKSKNLWERRTAIVSTWFFIRQGETDDTFKIAELLIKDKEEMVQTAVGSWLREAGKRDKKRLLALLDEYAAAMPRIALRFATEKLPKELREHYMKQSKS